MPSDILTRKALSLIRCLNRIQQKSPRTAAALKNDLDIQDIVSVNLQRAVQLCVDRAARVLAEEGVDVPVRMRDAFQNLADQSLISARTAGVMRQAVGFRNRAVHEYDEINWDIVHDIVTKRLGDLRRFLQELAKGGHLIVPALTPQRRPLNRRKTAAKKKRSR
jgi:uncharacterized protein YutE (UPF0331/DUF86 family)